MASLLLLLATTLQSFRECHDSFGPLRTRPEHQAIVSLPATSLKQLLLWAYLPIPVLLVCAANSSYAPASRLADLLVIVILSCGVAPFSAFGLWGRASPTHIVLLKGVGLMVPPLALLLPVVVALTFALTGAGHLDPGGLQDFEEAVRAAGDILLRDEASNKRYEPSLRNLIAR